MASPQLLITRIAAAGNLFSPLPYQAWHGYMVANAHREEVEVSADGLASATPSGAAAAAPPAGADLHYNSFAFLLETILYALSQYMPMAF
jgi:hypothetical protein